MPNGKRSHESLISEPGLFDEYGEEAQFDTNPHKLPVDQSYITEVGGNNPELGLYPNYDKNAKYGLAISDPIAPTTLEKSGWSKKLKDMLPRNKRLLGAAAGAIALSTALGVGIGVGQSIGAKGPADQGERHPAAAPAVPGVDQEKKVDENSPELSQPDLNEYELTEGELKRMNDTVRKAAVERVEQAKKATTEQDRLDSLNDHSYSFDTNSIGGSSYVSVRTKPTLTGNTITVYDSYTASDGYSKTITLDFDTSEKSVDDPVEAIRDGEDIKLAKYTETRKYDPESGEFGTQVTIDRHKVRVFSHEDAEGDKTKFTRPETKDAYTVEINKVTGYEGADR